MKIVAFGDSITYGDTGDHLEPNPRRWTNVLAERTGWEVLNKGVNYDTTRRALERFTVDVRGHLPAVVLVQFGFNDCNQWETEGHVPRVFLEAFRANLREIVARVRLIGARPLLCHTYRTLKTSDYERDREMYFWAAREIQTGFIPDLDPMKHCQLDGLHLNDAGNEVYAEQLAAIL